MPTIRDILLDEDGDLDLTRGGSWAADEDAIAQEIRVRLRTFLGEYFLDTLGRGLPYERWATSKWSDETRTEAAILVRDELLAVKGVARISDDGVTVSFDSATRAVTVAADVYTDTDELIPVSEVVTP